MNWTHQKGKLLNEKLICPLPTLNPALADDYPSRSMLFMSLLKLHSWLVGLKPREGDLQTKNAILAWQSDCADQLWSSWNAVRTDFDSAVATINVRYQSKYFRFRRIGNEWWYVASDVAIALGLRNSASLLSALPPSTRAKLRIGRRYLHTISQSGLERAYLMAPPARTEKLRLWLSDMQDGQAGMCLTPSISLSRDSAQATLDYLSRCRQSMRNAGAEEVEWDEALAQRIANSAASLLIRQRRWLLTFGEQGEPSLSVVPMDAGVFTADGLLNWISDLDGIRSDMLPRLLAAISERLNRHY